MMKKPTINHVRPWLRVLAWLVLLLPAAMIHPERSARARAPQITRPAKPPNILILIGDDHAGGTLGIDGEPHQATPRLDALARQGVRFDRAYCNSPVCTASRGSFITGRLPHAVGVTRLLTRLPDDSTTLGDWLGDLGYDTGAIGKMHFNGPSKHGFATRIDSNDWSHWLDAHPLPNGDHPRPWRPFLDPAAVWLNAAGHSYGLPLKAMESTYFVEHATTFLDEHKNKANPFALIVSFYEPHSPFKFPHEFVGRYKPDQFTTSPLSDFDRAEMPKVFSKLKPDEVKGIQASYFTSLNFHDSQVGKVLDALDASGLADDTIVVYFGDNGYMLGQHGRFEKHCFYENSVKVPLIFRWPGHFPKDRRVVELVELVDLLPTLLDLTGLPLPPDIHGQSLKNLVMGEANAKGRDVVFSEYLENEEAMVRSNRYKLIVGTGARRRRDGYETTNPTPGPYERLYDLETDPGETTNLRDKPELAEVAAGLRHKLFERLTTTRETKPPVPPGLNEIEAIRWCLVPQD